ncbi:MAG TPA: thiamine-phosphate kinase [Pirellulales bacterium]|jgi:thiamine-monophosphate kinase|nr:thiamine-phosphate kinase [Pirellulales bacterium]
MESDFIAWLRQRVARHPQLLLGPGDDAAILHLADRADCVVTVDLLTEGIDFKLPDVSAHRVGRKALAVSLSDLAAMAARPVGMVVAVALPRRGGRQLAVDLFEGLAELAERYGVAVAGGDTNSWDGPLVISTTAIGQTTSAGPLLRSGAKPGDRILVTGSFGGSILGKHLDFEPRVDEALVLADRCRLHAGIDASDGLSLDLSRMAAESRCGAVIDLAHVPIAPAAHELSRRQVEGRTPLEHALSDGEDFELILALAPDDAARLVAEQPLAPLELTDIGHFISEPGLWQMAADGARSPLAPRGWEHEFD